MRRRKMAARLARVRRAMVASGINARIVMAPDSQYWLCGLESFISGVLSQALIVPADDDRQMVLVVWDADAPLARATATVEQTKPRTVAVGAMRFPSERMLRSSSRLRTTASLRTACAEAYLCSASLAPAMNRQTCANTSDQPCALTLAMSHSLHRV